MNWEAVGAIAGIIGVGLVVVSLVYVGIQIRASVIQAKLDSYTKSTELWSQFTATVAGDEETWRVFHQGTHDYDSLDRVEKSRFSFVISMYFGIIDTIMAYERAGIFAEAETYQRSLDQAYAVFAMPGVQQWFLRSKGKIFAPSVENYLTIRHKKAEEST